MLEVRRTAEFAFGRPPEQTRKLDGDVLQITSRCPDTVVGTCDAAYRIAVRDNVQVNVITTSGLVRVSALNGSARLQTGSGRDRGRRLLRLPAHRHLGVGRRARRRRLLAGPDGAPLDGR